MESVDIKKHSSQAAAGNGGSFKVLYEHLIDRVFAYVAVRTNDRAVATEITQDIFIELHKSLPKFSYQSDAAFYSFVFTIARRKLMLQYTQESKQSTIELDESMVMNEEFSAEQIHSVHSALEALDEYSREIVVLHHWSRFTFAEIGELINMTESAVRVRHHRAKAALAIILKA